ncbi:MAG TPA: exosortase K [Thermoanaerobaculia bacterium]|jgi:exosortase K|nr:exosortase K [Thermoanaerobaculia bacterium]
MLAAYGLKLSYSRAAAEDLVWILGPTARAVGWLRGETLTLSPGAGWMAPDGSYVIAPACAGVNFMILVLTVAVLGFAHRLRSPGQRLSWWIGSLFGAYVLAIAVNTLRILAAVELYRVGPVTWLTREQEHRLLGTVLYLGALWGVFAVLDRLTTQGGAHSRLAAAVLVPGAYLGMTVLVPLVNGHSGGQYAEHAMMVSLATLILIGVFMIGRRRDGQTDHPGRRG